MARSRIRARYLWVHSGVQVTCTRLLKQQRVLHHLMLPPSKVEVTALTAIRNCSTSESEIWPLQKNTGREVCCADGNISLQGLKKEAKPTN